MLSHWFTLTVCTISSFNFKLHWVTIFWTGFPWFCHQYWRTTLDTCHTTITSKQLSCHLSSDKVHSYFLLFSYSFSCLLKLLYCVSCDRKLVRLVKVAKRGAMIVSFDTKSRFDQFWYLLSATACGSQTTKCKWCAAAVPQNFVLYRAALG